jgi:signal transduction histidine kinase
VLAQKNEIQAAENDKYQRQLLSAAIKVEEKERERIAKNIHDDIGTLLNVMKMNLSRLTRNPQNEELVKKLGTENMELLDRSIDGIRGIAKDLVPPTLLKLGYIPAVSEMCRFINSSGQIAITFNTDHVKERVSPQTELQLYRLTLELTNNVMKHADATEIAIELKEVPDFYNVYISHNGKGITSEQAYELSKEERGLGLKSIQSRAQLINAQVNYFAEPGQRPGISIELLT